MIDTNPIIRKFTNVQNLSIRITKITEWILILNKPDLKYREVMEKFCKFSAKKKKNTVSRNRESNSAECFSFCIRFDTQGFGGFIFADQFLQISSKFSGRIYGLGEHRSTFWLDTNWTRFTLFAHDTPPRENVSANFKFAREEIRN